MKKYVKPELFYEHFELSTQVAACEFDHRGTLTDKNTCTFTQDDTDIVLFIEANTLCVWTPEEMGIVGSGGDCYYTGGSETTPGLGLFNS